MGVIALIDADSPLADCTTTRVRSVLSVALTGTEGVMDSALDEVMTVRDDSGE